MSNRNAYSLVELMVTMSIGSSLMLLAVGLVHQSFTLSSTAKSRIDHQRATDRLSHDFRQDVHRASEAIIDQPEQVELVRSDGVRIRYVADGSRVQREETLNGEVQRREAYRLSESLLATFQTVNQPRRLILQLSPTASNLPVTTPARQVAAVLGRTLTHERGALKP
jgi:prepilin-type N-terminal cleavage/methylation domain-containing protein